MRLTLKSIQEQASASGYQVEKAASGYVVNGQKFRLLVEVADHLNRCLGATVAPDLTVKEVQQLAEEIGFLVQVTEDGYGIFFEGQLLGVAKLLFQVIEALPQYKEAIARYRQEETLEIRATNRPNVFVCCSHKPGIESNHYEVDLIKNSCTCLHYKYRHKQEGFKDKHIEAVKAAIAAIAKPTNLPKVGDTHVAGSFVLRCADLKSEDYAAVWNVWEGKALLGEIRMGWDGFWNHPLSFNDFYSPQEAIASLSEFAQELISIPEFEEKEEVEIQGYRKDAENPRRCG